MAAEAEQIQQAKRRCNRAGAFFVDSVCNRMSLAVPAEQLLPVHRLRAGE